MKIEYSNYLPNGEVARKCRINIKSRNEYYYYNLYEKFTENHTWYTKYDLGQNRYYKFSNLTNELIKEGEMKNGYFKLDQNMNRELIFDKYTTFMGLDAIQFIEKINSVQNRIIALHNNFINELIEDKYLYKIPISSQQSIGKEYKEYGLIATRETKYNSRYNTMFEITEIFS